MSARSPITTHILDTSRGRPAAGVSVLLEISEEGTAGRFRKLGCGATDSDGRLGNLLSADRPLLPGTYRLTFDTGAYFRAQQTEGFYPYVAVVFTLRKEGEHYHVPLLLSPYGYSTYRGS